MARRHRILLLLLLLLLVAGTALWERLWVRGWTRPLEVAIYPVPLDPAAGGFLREVRAGDFDDIGAFLVREAARWGRPALPPPRITVHPPRRQAPPAANIDGALDAIGWSLRLRWYAFRQTPFWDSLGAVRLFVLYHPPAENRALPHSHGLQKGLVGVVHVFANHEQRDQNNFVITHELLHALGATDKYDARGQPVVPIGLADPHANPPWPQDRAEIMGGRIALGPDAAEMPKGLHEAVIGYATAAEIGW